MDSTTEKSLEQKFNERKEISGLLPAVQIYWKQITVDFLKTFNEKDLLKIVREISITGYGNIKERAFVAYIEKAKNRSATELAQDYNYLNCFFPIDIDLLQGCSGKQIFLQLVEKMCDKNLQMWEDIYKKADNHSDLKKMAEKAIANL